jgi:hypothetical protein
MSPFIFFAFSHLRLIPADRTGLEPATSAVTGRHSNQLNYRSNWCSRAAKIEITFKIQTMNAYFRS